MLIKDNTLEKVTGAGVTPAEPKFKVGDRVWFYGENGATGGEVVDIYGYLSSRRSWMYVIDYGGLVQAFVYEEDMFTRKR